MSDKIFVIINDMNKIVMVKCPILPYNVRSNVASSLMIFAFPNVRKF